MVVSGLLHASTVAFPGNMAGCGSKPPTPASMEYHRQAAPPPPGPFTHPGTTGYLAGPQSPLMVCRSLWHMPVCVILMNTSLGPS
jgi:hypothetical protein